MRARLALLGPAALPIAQTALAAALAWLVALELVGHERPFFAPIAATISLGVTVGQRGRRTVELVVGVALGVLVADLLVAELGTGTVQIALVVGLSMVVAVLIGGGPLLVTQAATSAVLVAALQPPDGGFDFARALDALVGGATGLLVSQLLPIDPVARTRRAAGPLLDELAAVLDDVAGALERGDADAAEAALLRARATDDPVRRFRETVEAGRETIRGASPRRSARPRLAPYVEAADQLDLAARDVRVLARAALRPFGLGERVPPELPEAIRDLGRAVRALEGELAGDDAAGAAARTAAVRAAGRATLVLEQTGNLSVSQLVAQVRATAVDLLRSLGLEREDAQRAVREAAHELGR